MADYQKCLRNIAGRLENVAKLHLPTGFQTSDHKPCARLLPGFASLPMPLPLLYGWRCGEVSMFLLHRGKSYVSLIASNPANGAPSKCDTHKQVGDQRKRHSRHTERFVRCGRNSVSKNVEPLDIRIWHSVAVNYPIHY